MEKEVLWLRDVEKSVSPFLGDKSKTASKLFFSNIHVPYGFIVPVSFYNEYLQTTGIKQSIKLLMSGLNVSSKDDIQSRANEIQKLIVTTEMSLSLKESIIEAYKSLDIDEKKVKDWIRASARSVLVSVRSDPFPGYENDKDSKHMHMSFLNVKGEDLLIRTVQACWASLYTAKAVEYRASKNMDQTTCAMSVLIQRMIPVRKSGYLITSAPDDENASLIEACLGMMKSHDGKCAPMSKYAVNSRTMSTLSSDIGYQNVRFIYDEDDGKYEEEDIRLLPSKNPLNETELFDLVNTGKNAESVLGGHLEIEWIFYNNFYIVSARKIGDFSGENIIEDSGENIFEEQIQEAAETAEAIESMISSEEIPEELPEVLPFLHHRKEEVNVSYDENKDKIIVEQKIENESGETEKTFELDPEKFLEDSRVATLSTLSLIHKAVETAVRKKENDWETNFKDLLARQDYHSLQELEMLDQLHEDFQSEKEIDINDVRHALESAQNFISYLKDHDLI